MLNFREFLHEERRMSREKDWNPISMHYAPGAPKGSKPNKSVLDFKIQRHKVRQHEAEYQAKKAAEKAQDKREIARKSGHGDRNPVTDFYDDKARRAAHIAKRHRQAAEAGERVRSGTERTPKYTLRNRPKVKSVTIARTRPGSNTESPERQAIRRDAERVGAKIGQKPTKFQALRYAWIHKSA